MALNIKDAATDRLARDVAEATGQSITQAVHSALQEKLARLRSNPVDTALVDDLALLAGRSAALPLLDDRTADEIIGYDENGLPT